MREHIEVLNKIKSEYVAECSDCGDCDNCGDKSLCFDFSAIQVLNMAIKALEQESIKFYYVESLDDYWIGRRLDNFYYATWHGRLGFVWSHSKYLPWGEHIVDENTLWKECTYPSEPKEIPFVEWIIGFTKKYFKQEPKRGKWIPLVMNGEYKCSVCGRASKSDNAAWVNIPTAYWNYCPNCGARMESGDE